MTMVQVCCGQKEEAVMLDLPTSRTLICIPKHQLLESGNSKNKVL